MLVDIGYDRNSALSMQRNGRTNEIPNIITLINFEDCTNFVSQCILSGCQVMNYKPTLAGTISI